MMSRKQTLASDVLAALEAKKLSLATAESCTGGGVGQALTAVPGSSRVYRGGIISYTNEVKSGLLHVPETLLRDLGAVSGPVAEAMARGAREALGCDMGLSTGGVAGPDPDDRGNPVGLVYLGLAWAGGCHVATYQGGRVERERIRRQSAQTALDLLRRHLTGAPLL